MEEIRRSFERVIHSKSLISKSPFEIGMFGLITVSWVIKPREENDSNVSV